MTNELKTLPKPEKKVAAKVLVNEGYSTREIEELLDADHSSVARWAKLDTPLELKKFEERLCDVFRQREHIVAAKALRRVEETVPRARILEALEVYKNMRGIGGAAAKIQTPNMSVEFITWDSK